MSEVDVVVPVLDGGERFAACLAALAAQRDVDCRVLVVDNGSGDGSAAWASAAGCTVLHEPRRSSYAARNRALAHVDAPVVAFTDADCVPEPDWLRRGLDALSATGADLVAGAVHMEPARTTAGRHDVQTYLDQEVMVGRGYAATANLFVRVEVLDEIGPFDASLRSGGDMDLTMRAVAAGRRLVFDPSPVVHHPPREGLAAAVRKTWRIGIGHGALMATGRRPVRPALRWRRLVPTDELRAARPGPGVLVVDVGLRLVAYAARVTGMADARLRGSSRREPDR